VSRMGRKLAGVHDERRIDREFGSGRKVKATDRRCRVDAQAPLRFEPAHWGSDEQKAPDGNGQGALEFAVGRLRDCGAVRMSPGRVWGCFCHPAHKFFGGTGPLSEASTGSPSS